MILFNTFQLAKLLSWLQPNLMRVLHKTSLVTET